MSERLQKSRGAAGKATAPVRPNQLIIDDAFCYAVIPEIKRAKSIIRVCAYAWRWYEYEPGLGIQKFNTEIIKAKNRGVEIKVIVNSEVMNRFFRRLGLKTRFIARNRMLHTKAISVDEAVLVLGSHNLTKRANTDNMEMSIITADYEVNAQFIKYFDTLWAASHES